ncbi:C25 family cysteine peptidase [Chloroflexota bacterium]
MRKFFSLIFISIMLLGVFSAGWGTAKEGALAPAVDFYFIIDSTADQLVLQVDLPDLAFTTVDMFDLNTYQAAIANGAGIMSLPGMPDVPVYRYWILVPNGRTADIFVDPGIAEVHYGIDLAPAQPPNADVEGALIPPFTKDELTYGTDADYPGVLAQLGEVQIMRGQQMAMLEIFPYQYNPIQDTLREYRDLNITVTFSGELQPIDHRLKSKAFDDIYRNMAINAGDILPAQEEVEPTLPIPRLGDYGWDYLIFTDPVYLAAANAHAAWKKTLGFKTLVTVLPKGWKATDLKNGILTAYDTWDVPPEYVLLIGDADQIPTFYGAWHIFNSTLMSSTPNTQGRVGTDLYYSTLEGPLAGDPNSDLVPDVLLGRLSVENAVQADDRVASIYDYERWPPSQASFYDTIVSAAYFQDGGTYQYRKSNGTLGTHVIPANGIADRRFTQTTEDFALTMENATNNKTVERLYWAYSTVTPTTWNDNNQNSQAWQNWSGANTTVGGAIPTNLLRANGFGWDATPVTITQEINAGAFLVTHRDHGDRQEWSHPNYDFIDVSLLGNTNLTPVVWSFNCQTGWFDNETDFKSLPGMTDFTTSIEEAFSEAWERPLAALFNDNNYGAVGVIAPTRVTFSGYNDRLFDGMADSIWPDVISSGGPPTLGPVYEMASVMNLGKGYMQTMLGLGITGTIELEGFHWFGDPAMEIRTKKPPLMAVLPTDPWSWAYRRAEYIINVSELTQDNQPAAPIVDAKVAIAHPDRHEDHWVGRTNEAGDVVIDMLADEAGSYNLTVMASNYTPFTTTFEVTAGPAAGLRFDRRGYTCDSEVFLRLADIDLEGLPDITLQVVAEDGLELGDTLEVTLVQEEMGTGIFRASFMTVYGEPYPDDDVLQVMDVNWFGTEYFDENDGLGGGGVISDTVFTDCAPPEFAGLESATAGVCSIDLSWQPGLDFNGPLEYYIYRSDIPGLLGDLIYISWSEFFSDRDCQIGKTFYYTVVAVDRLGQASGHDVQLGAAFNGVYLPMVVDGD